MERGGLGLGLSIRIWAEFDHYWCMISEYELGRFGWLIHSEGRGQAWIRLKYLLTRTDVKYTDRAGYRPSRCQPGWQG